MPRLTKAELARKDLVDIVRTRVRLEHRIQQRRELNEIENDLIEEFERRLQSGEPFEPEVEELLKALPPKKRGRK